MGRHDYQESRGFPVSLRWQPCGNRSGPVTVRVAADKGRGKITPGLTQGRTARSARPARIR